MRIHNLLFLLAAMPLLGNAQPSGMDQQQMQQMMQQAQKAQACMEKLDRSKMEALMQEGQAMEKEVNALCQAGKRSQAQSKALKYGSEIARSSEMKELRVCSEIMRKAMPDMIPEMKLPSVDEMEKQHVCDSL